MTREQLLPLLTPSQDALVIIEDRAVSWANPTALSRHGEALLSAQVLQHSPQLLLRLPALEQALAASLRPVGDVQVAVVTGPADAELAWLSRGVDFSAVVGGVVHEMNNPLSYLVSNAQIALSLIDGSPDDRAAARECLEDIVSGGRRLEALALQLRGFALAESAQGESAADVDTVIAAAHTLSRSLLRGRARVVTDLRSGAHAAMPPGWLLRIGLVLMHNAARACPARRPHSTVALRSRRLGDTVEISVRDDGVGVPEALTEQIFAPFFSTWGSVGVGLSVARTIAAHYGGTLRCVPVDNGASFVLTLPAATPPQRPLLSPQRPLRVLAIEPEPARQRWLRRLLAGHTVSVAASVEEAAALLAAPAPVDAILCAAGIAEDLGPLLALRPPLLGRVLWLDGETLRQPMRPRLRGPIDREHLLDALVRMTR